MIVVVVIIVVEVVVVVEEEWVAVEKLWAGRRGWHIEGGMVVVVVVAVVVVVEGYDSLHSLGLSHQSGASLQRVA